MGYGDDIITSDGFEPDEDDEFDAAGDDAELGSDDEFDWDDEEPAAAGSDREAG